MVKGLKYLQHRELSVLIGETVVISLLYPSKIFPHKFKKLLNLWRDEEGSEINEFCLTEG